MTTEMERVPEMLSEFLAAMGFGQMALDCAAEKEWKTLQRYARIVVKNMNASNRKMGVIQGFRHLGLVF